MDGFRLDRGSVLPAYRQICREVADAVDRGRMRPGDRLPASRVLARTLGVHRSTVVRAYEELRALGYLEATSGSYSTIRHRARPPQTRVPATSPASVIDWERAARPHLRACTAETAAEIDTLPDDGLVDFERLAADPRLAPYEDVRRTLREALTRHRGRALDYADPRGWRPLREALAGRMARHGIAVSPDDVLVTAGAQHALDLVLRLLVQPGDAVVVEAPTYGMAHALLRLHGVRPVEVPLSSSGMDLQALEAVLTKARPRLVYTVPTFHNPTGLTAGQAHRERLLALCESARIPILEDGFEEEMKYFGREVQPIKAIDARGIVLYVGTFSKVVFPGLRVGWVAGPPEAIGRLTQLLGGTCLSGHTLGQIAAARFMRGAAYENHLRRVHREYRSRMRAMLRGLDAHLPDDAAWTRPGGGYTLWLTLPDRGGDERKWVRRFQESGVRVAPGSRFFASPPDKRPAVRLSIACVSEQEIGEGCARLGRAFSNLAGAEPAKMA